MTGLPSALTFPGGVPHVKKGLGLAQVSFSGGRLCATLGSHGGLTKIDYYGKQRFGGARLFSGNDVSAWTQLFRLFYYDPYVERFYVEVAKLNRRSAGIAHFARGVAWFWRQFTVPEAMTAEMENHGVTVDDPGKHQLFSMKAWCSIFFHTLAGFELEAEGLAFTACDGEPMALEGIPIRGQRIDLTITGRGWHIDRLLLDGKPVTAPHRVPYAALKRHSKINLHRTTKRTAS